MGNTSNRRVEWRPASIGRVLGNYVEQVREWEVQRAGFDKSAVFEPSKSFSSVLADISSDSSHPQASEQEKSLTDLPKKGPTITWLRHRIQVRLGGPREGEEVILKG